MRRRVGRPTLSVLSVLAVLSIRAVGWDADRPVPWKRLTREYLIYAAIMAVVFLVVFRDRGVVPLLTGLVAAGPIYLALGAVMAKFGYQRKTLAEMRTPRASPSSSPARGDDAARSARARPAPTRRTSAGSNRPNRPSRRKR